MASVPEYRTVGQAETVSLQLKPDTRYMINPGSVGQPRDGDWRAAFALFDTEAQVVHFHRTPYNLKAAQDRIFAAEPARRAWPRASPPAAKPRAASLPL